MNLVKFELSAGFLLSSYFLPLMVNRDSHNEITVQINTQ